MSIYMNNLPISLFGESHGPLIGITIHRFPHGIRLDVDKIQSDLKKRNQYIIGKSSRVEEDQFEIVSGVYNGYTTGAPLTFIIHNKDIQSAPYLENMGTIRPSHSDYTAFMKYDGFNDPRGGGHLSGRMTALYVILGSLCEQQLNEKNICIKTRIKSLHVLNDDQEIQEDSILDQDTLTLSAVFKDQMMQFLDTLENDSAGGVVETKVFGMPVGLGEGLFDSVESMISHLMFSIPAVKGIEFGSGFDLAMHLGSEVNDHLRYEENRVTFLSNHAGGILGGMTTGEAVAFRVAIKPTPTIAKKQTTINILTHETITLESSGRHDKSIVLKAAHVIKAMTAYAMYNLILGDRMHG